MIRYLPRFWYKKIFFCNQTSTKILVQKAKENFVEIRSDSVVRVKTRGGHIIIRLLFRLLRLCWEQRLGIVDAHAHQAVVHFWTSAVEGRPRRFNSTGGTFIIDKELGTNRRETWQLQRLRHLSEVRAATTAGGWRRIPLAGALQRRDALFEHRSLRL